MRLFRRNALGFYAVYGAAMVSGLVVTPILLDSIGTEAFGIWAFIGGITIYLAVLDIGLGPSVVRFTAEAHGRRDPEEINRVASVALVLYAAIGVLTLVAGAVLSWFVPVLIETPDDLVWDARVSTFLVTLSLAVRFPLGLFYNLLGGRHRFDLQNLGNFVATVLYARPRRAADPARRRPRAARGADDPRHGPAPGAAARLAAARAARAARCGAIYVTRARMRDLVGVSWSNFLVHVANKVVFSTDVVVVGIVLGAARGGDLRDRIEAVPARVRPGQRRHVAALPGVRRVRGIGRAGAAAAAAAVGPARRLGGRARAGAAAARDPGEPDPRVGGRRILGVGADPGAARARPARPPAGLDADAVPDRARPPARDRQAADRRGGGEPRAVGRDGADSRDVGRRARDAARDVAVLAVAIPLSVGAGGRTTRGRALARAAAAGAAGARDRAARLRRRTQRRRRHEARRCSRSGSPGSCSPAPRFGGSGSRPTSAAPSRARSASAAAATPTALAET